MRRVLLSVLAFLVIGSPALAQTPTPVPTHPPTEIPDDGCTSIPQVGGCEDEEEVEEPTPSPSPTVVETTPPPPVTVGSSPTPTPPTTSPTLVPPTTAPVQAPAPEESLIPALFIERDQPKELPATGPVQALLLGLVGLALVVFGSVMLWKGRREFRRFEESGGGLGGPTGPGGLRS